MTVYLDIVFLENICMNYIILFATSYIAKINVKQIRIILSAILGSVYATFAYMYQNSLFSNVIVKILLSIVMITVGFNQKSLKQLLKQIVLFYLVSFVFGGCAIFLLYFIKPQNIIIRNGVYVGKYPIKIALLGAIVGFVITQIAFKFMKTRITRKNIISKIVIYFNQKKLCINALLDTGNMLKDPLSNTPVIVVQKDVLYGLFPDLILDNLQKIMNSEYSNNILKINSNIISKIRIIPFSSLGKQNGILLGVKVDKLHIILEDTEKEISDVIVAIYDKKFASRGEYAALVGLNLIEDRTGETDEYFRPYKIKN